jgi:hypothetical protein
MTVSYRKDPLTRRTWIELWCQGCGQMVKLHSRLEAHNFMLRQGWTEIMEKSEWPRDERELTYTEHFCCAECRDPPEWAA